MILMVRVPSKSLQSELNWRKSVSPSTCIQTRLVYQLDPHAESSLVPRPFPPPVFDRILYAKTEGEAWEKESRA